MIPSWAKDESAGVKAINVRAETIAEKPFFRSAFGKCRCLIPASGFYEWAKVGKAKQPFFIHPAHRSAASSAAARSPARRWDSARGPRA